MNYNQINMTEHQRPDPDTLLTHVQREESRRGRGKLKIFLGYVAGVGKTYAMLEAAQQRVAEGFDLVVGYVETHGRAETERLLESLEVIPRRQIEHRGVKLPEMDLDAVLARHPQIALVDELAHTNAPGSRHAKRYQDVLELLEAGIDVYTTLNIQHLESLNDIVAQITGTLVRETVPDRLLDEAHDIELIDLPSAELLQRLQEGKVYVPEQAARAIQKFFRPGNLTALRELALRRAADRIDEQLRAYMQTHAIAGPWPANERVLVCVSPSPLSERLVRAGRRLATRLNAEWFAVYVETPGAANLSETARERVVRTLHLAETLGAQPVSITGRSVAEGIVTFAQNRNVTKIVVGKPLRPRWVELLRGSLIDQIIRLSQDVDVYVISGEPVQSSRPAIHQASVVSTTPGWAYAQSTGLILLVTLIGFPLRPFVEPTNLVMLYLVAVVIVALWLGRRPAMLASLLSVFAFNFVFVPPYYTYRIANAQYLLTFMALFIVGVVISTLAAQARDQAQAARRREAQTAALYELSRGLATAVEIEPIAEVVTRHIRQLFGRESVLLLPGKQGLETWPASTGSGLAASEQAVAAWVFEHGQPAGQGTDTLTGVDGFYLPLKMTQVAIGVLIIHFTKVEARLLPEQQRLLEAFAGQAAQALERVQLTAKVRQAQLLQEAEKLQTALLNSISHDLRTPLASITGALSSLREDEAVLAETDRQTLLTTAWEQADRLNTLVGNLLDMTRLESGALRLRLEPSDLQDVIGVALIQLTQRLGQRPIQVEVLEGLPLVPLDFVLIVQVLVNLLDNALKYSPPDRPVTIRVSLNPAEAVIEVIDQGRGIPAEDLARIFDKFYRSQPPNGAGGTGLGLSISKGIIEAHQGRIWAENRPGVGTVVAIALPLNEPGRKVAL